MNKKLLPLALLILSIPLAGATAKDVVGCGGCSGGKPAATPAPTTGGGNLPGGGGVAASLTYSLDRADIGKSYEGPESSKKTYRIGATLGGFLSQGRTLSDKYMIHHPMGREIISAASALRAKNNSNSEASPGAEPAEPAEPVPAIENQPTEEKPPE